MPIRALAIDDEPMALQVVETFAGRVPFVELVGAYESPYDAQAELDTGTIDLLFLDINMPDITGTDFLRSLKNPPLVIFTTAYKEFALEGFDLDAVDYLLKPYPYDRFLKAVTKAQTMLQGQSAEGQDTTQSGPGPDDFILIKVEHQQVRVPLAKLLFVEGQKDYLKLYLEDKPHPLMTLKSMRSLEKEIAAFGFMRIHRSYLIALHRLDSFKKTQVQIGKHTLPIGDTYQATFREKMGS